MRPPKGFADIATARHVKLDTVAELLMPSGRIYRCIWAQRGKVTAWWPLRGQLKKSPIGLYDAVAWKALPNVVPLRAA